MKELYLRKALPMSVRALTAFFGMIATVFAASSLVAGEARGPLTLDELIALPHVRSVTSDGNGNIAWIEDADGLRNAFVSSVPDFKPRQVTHYQSDDGQTLKTVGFALNGSLLIVQRGLGTLNPAHIPNPPKPALFSVTLKDNQISKMELGDAIGNPEISSDGAQLYTTKGGEVWSLSFVTGEKAKQLFTVRGRITKLLISPDGKKLAFVSNRSVYNRGKYAYVGVYDFATHKITYMEPGLAIDQNPVWSPDSSQIAFIRFGYEPRTWRFSNHREGGLFSVMVVDASTGEGEAVFTSEPGYGSRFNGFYASGYSGLGGRGNLFWLKDGSLVFPYEKTGWKLLYSVPAKGGKAKLLTSGEFEITGASVSPDRSSIIYWANSEADLHRLDMYRMQLKRDMKPEVLGKPAGEAIRHSAVYVSTDIVAYRHSGSKTADRLVVSSSANTVKQLSSGPRPGDLFSSRGRNAEIRTFKSLDGMEIPAILYSPHEINKNGKNPVLVVAHGGPRTKDYPVWDTYFGRATVIDYFLNRGYYVFDVNYRSGVGYGLNFREPESYGGRGAGDVQDFIAAAEYLKKNVPQIDPDRMAIYGHSYGGHIVSNTLARSDVYVLGIDSAGVGDWVVEMEKDFGEQLQFNIPERVELESMAHNSSAISKIDEWGNEPILFLHGDNDSSAAMQQSLELYLALQRRGKEVDALIFPGEAHGILLRRNQVKYIKKIEAFLDKYLK